jgi:hypothetical protein
VKCVDCGREPDDETDGKGLYEENGVTKYICHPCWLVEALGGWRHQGYRCMGIGEDTCTEKPL